MGENLGIERREFLAATGLAGMASCASRAIAATARPPWDMLKAKLGERLQPVSSPLVAVRDAGGRGADALFANLKNPYFISDDPALTETLGWTDAWTSEPSSYVAAARSAALPHSTAAPTSASRKSSWSFSASPIDTML